MVAYPVASMTPRARISRTLTRLVIRCRRPVRILHSEDPFLLVPAPPIEALVAAVRGNPTWHVFCMDGRLSVGHMELLVARFSSSLVIAGVSWPGVAGDGAHVLTNEHHG